MNFLKLKHPPLIGTLSYSLCLWCWTQNVFALPLSPPLPANNLSSEVPIDEPAYGPNQPFLRSITTFGQISQPEKKQGDPIISARHNFTLIHGENQPGQAPTLPYPSLRPLVVDPIFGGVIDPGIQQNQNNGHGQSGMDPRAFTWNGDGNKTIAFPPAKYHFIEENHISSQDTPHSEVRSLVLNVFSHFRRSVSNFNPEGAPPFPGQNTTQAPILPGDTQASLAPPPSELNNTPAADPEENKTTWKLLFGGMARAVDNSCSGMIIFFKKM